MYTRFGMNTFGAGLMRRSVTTGLNRRGKQLGKTVQYDQPTHEWLFNAADGVVIRDQAGATDLQLNTVGTPSMQWVGSAATRGLDMNTPPTSYNPDNYWRAVNSLGYNHTAFTVYAWITMNTADDIFDFMAFSKLSGSVNPYRWKLGVGHSKHFEPRTVFASGQGDYWLRSAMAGLPNHPSGPNQGTEYQSKMPIVYRLGGTKKYVSFVDGQTYLVKFGWQTIGPNNAYTEVGIAKNGDAFGFDPEGTGPDAAFKTQWRREFSGRTMVLPTAGEASLYRLTSNSAPVSEQSDVTYHKILYYDTLKGFEHDQRVFADGLNKNSWFS
ncbi:MAG: hypothetical protein VKJ06_01620 [Vampirovibrionales bacterium]|nr:hypothetical protein [Vampirovibrionales bacterium]